jgi:hypothetical protein
MTNEAESLALAAFVSSLEVTREKKKKETHAQQKMQGGLIPTQQAEMGKRGTLGLMYDSWARVLSSIDFY